MNNEHNCRTIGGVLYPAFLQIYDAQKREPLEILASLKVSPLANPLSELKLEESKDHGEL